MFFECLLCDLKGTTVKIMKKPYVDYHEVNEKDPHFIDLFEPDTVKRTCGICRAKFDNCRLKKKHMLLYRYGQQVGGSKAKDLPLNILKRGPITYHTINFDQHKKYCDFFSTDMIDVFLDSVYNAFKPKHVCKFQGYVEIINQQKGETALEDTRTWLTKVFHFKYFNEFVWGEIKDEIMKKVVFNEQTVSS